MPQTAPETVNGLDVTGLLDAIEQIARDPRKGRARFCVRTAWKGQTATETRVDGYHLAGERIPRFFRFSTDEPFELFGGNGHANPQEYLLGAMNACMIVGYAAGAAVRGIRLEKLEIETTCELDLRGFLGLDDSVPPGSTTVAYTVRLRGDGTPRQFREIHDTVQKTSPNYFNVARALKLDGHLVVED